MVLCPCKAILFKPLWEVDDGNRLIAVEEALGVGGRIDDRRHLHIFGCVNPRREVARIGGVVAIDDDDGRVLGVVARKHDREQDGDHHRHHDGDLLIRHSLPREEVAQFSFE